MKLLYILIVLLLAFLDLSATHNRAGEITYTHLYGYTYEIKVITYTYSKSLANHNREELSIDWGDNTTSLIRREEQYQLPDEYLKNVYVARHTFPGPGIYEIMMLDYNRNEGIENIFDSVNIPFSITTTLHISPLIGDNSTPQLLNPPYDKAAKGAVFIHNPAAYDPDGDSLSYDLTVCTGEGGEPIDGYTYPTASNKFYINETTGDLVWDAPTQIGKYNVAIVVKEWRNGQKIGQIVRDIQIEVIESDNEIPEIDELKDWCVYENDTVQFTVSATDKDNGLIILDAVGGPFSLDDNKPDFNAQTGSGVVESEFLWVPSCDEVRESPYQIVFKASNHFDNTTFSDMDEIEITVLPQPPVLDSAVAKINVVELFWNYTPCDNLVRYDIYRSDSPVSIEYDSCSVGMPDGIGYVKVGEVADGDGYFEDTDNGIYLNGGQNYCYRIVAVYKNEYESAASNEICVEVKNVLPRFTNVSVVETSEEGSINVAWTKHKIDTLQFKPPYLFKLYRAKRDSILIYNVVTEFSDTSTISFIDSGINTLDDQWAYKLETYYTVGDETQLLGTSAVAFSLYLKLDGANNALVVSVEETVPWENYKYYVFDELNDTLLETRNFPDVVGDLINGTEYCLVTESYGRYSEEQKLVNRSQLACAVPNDTIPPQPVELKVSQICDSLQNYITWEYSDTVQLFSDVLRFDLYYTECENEEYVKLNSFLPDDREYYHDFSDLSVANLGCYYMIAVDSALNHSAKALPVCVQACQNYRLPNVFTPNGDGVNDVFTPFEPFSQVKKIDMQIYSSWGTLVYDTSEPQINWNGISSVNDMKVPDGVYYYVCDVYEKWLSCEVEPRSIFGFIQILRNQDPDINSNSVK